MILQQRLQADAVVALDAEGARDLALADRLGAVVDEREHLFLAGEGRGADPFGLLWVRIPGAGRVLLAGQDQSAAVSSAAALDRKSTRLNSSHYCASRMPSSA